MESTADMGRFVFELEAVLEQRRRVERDRQLVVAAIEADRLAIEDRVRRLQEAIVAERVDLHQRLSPTRDGPASLVVADIRLQANASFHLMARIQQEALRLAEVHGRLERARKDLLAATTARKAVELLRERRYEQWKRMLAKREASALDELAVMRAGRDGSDA
jgi:flagellar export protein FliJ